MTTTTTPSRPHLVSASTLEVGDILVQGFGSLTITVREVASVERWTTPNNYTNARVTYTNGDTETIYAGTLIHNQRYYIERGTGPIYS